MKAFLVESKHPSHSVSVFVYPYYVAANNHKTAKRKIAREYKTNETHLKSKACPVLDGKLGNTPDNIWVARDEGIAILTGAGWQCATTREGLVRKMMVKMNELAWKLEGDVEHKPQKRHAIFRTELFSGWFSALHKYFFKW